MPLLRRSEPTALVKVEECSVPVTLEQQQAYAAIYHSLFQRLVAFARRYVDRETARDLVHEVLTEVWTRFAEGKIGMPNAMFFYRAVRNKIADEREREFREEVSLGVFLRQLARRMRRTAVDATIERWELARVVDACVATMPMRCRTLWVLVRENRLTYEEAAVSLGISVKGAKALMTRAQAYLREALADAGYRESPLLPKARRPNLLPTSAAEDEDDA